MFIVLNTSNWGNSGHLGAALAAAATELMLAYNDGLRFAVPMGDHYYLTIREGDRREVVRVTSASGQRLTIVRAQDGTQAQAFAIGACVEVEWNPQQLREFLEGIVTGCESVVTPGTYCLTCNTCVTVNACGQITSINGAEGC